jgi:hypothetical protein
MMSSQEINRVSECIPNVSDTISASSIRDGYVGRSLSVCLLSDSSRICSHQTKIVTLRCSGRSNLHTRISNGNCAHGMDTESMQAVNEY